MGQANECEIRLNAKCALLMLYQEMIAYKLGQKPHYFFKITGTFDINMFGLFNAVLN